MATEKQAAALAKARAARTAKKEGTVETSSGPVNVEVAQTPGDGRVWIDALLTAMRTREVKSPVSVSECVPIADEVLKLYKARF